MSKAERQELERLVQDVARAHPDWNSGQIEKELAARVPVIFGNWRDDTPLARSRARQIQRWMRGDRSDGASRRVRTPFQHLWPIGEAQRHLIDPGVPTRHERQRASHRIFLRNLADQTLRELHARLGGREILYEPALAPGVCAELPWTRNDAVRRSALRSDPAVILSIPFEAEFSLQDGFRRVRLSGDFRLHPSDGWISFRSSDGLEKEIE